MPSGGGGTQTQTTQSQVNLTPEQQELLRIMMPGIKSHIEKPVELFPKSTVAELNPLQLQAQQMMLGLTGQNGALTRIAGESGSALTSLLQGGPQAQMSPELQASITKLLSGQAPTMATPAVGNTGAITNVGPAAQAGPAGVASVAPSAKAQVQSTGVDPYSLSQMFNPGQNASLQNAALLGPGQLQNTNPELAQAMSFLLGPVLNTSTNPALQQAISAATQPVMEQYQETVLPAIRRGAIEAGQLGGNRQGIAEGIASREFMRQVGDISSKMQNEAYGKGLDAVTTTANTTQNTNVQALQALLQNEAAKLGISADVLTKSLSDQLSNETQRLGIAQEANTADTAVQSALQQAMLQAKTQLQLWNLNSASQLQQGQLSAGTQQNIANLNANTQTNLGALEANTSLANNALTQQGAQTTAQTQNATTNRGLTLDALIKGLTQSQGVAGLQTMPASLTGAVGDQNYALTQAKLSEEAQKWIAEQTKNFASIQDVAQLFFGMPGGQSSTSTGPAPPSQTFNQVSSAATTAMLAYMLFTGGTGSERTLKYMIRKVGVLRNGIVLYRFRYLFDKMESFGAMAEEVERIMPSAVIEVDGLRKVHYGKLFATQFA